MKKTLIFTAILSAILLFAVCSFGETVGLLPILEEVESEPETFELPTRKIDYDDYNFLSIDYSVDEFDEHYDELVAEYCEPEIETGMTMG